MQNLAFENQWANQENPFLEYFYSLNAKNSEIKIEATFYGTICKSIERFVMPSSWKLKERVSKIEFVQSNLSIRRERASWKFNDYASQLLTYLST